MSQCILVSGECEGEAGGVSKTLSWSERRRSRSSSSRFDIVRFVILVQTAVSAYSE